MIDLKSAGGALALLVAGAAPAAAEEPVADCTGPASPIRLFVDVQGVRSDRGQIAVTLYADDHKRFLAKKGSLYTGRVTSRTGTTRVCIHLPALGTYALAVYHDADGNQRFNRSIIGFPAEAYGFSNNPSTLFGLPSFSSVRITVSATNQETTIKLKYP
jgi:uncharacterized protein (DUF2141 family)